MRAGTLLLISSLMLGLAGPALAQDEEEAGASAPEEAAAAAEPAAEEQASEEEAVEDEEPGFLAQYGTDFANTFLAGANGLLTWPADPVMLTVQPTEEMLDMPGGVVTGRITGFFAGTLQGVYRLVTGAFDVALAPLTFFPMFSPEPRYKLIPGWEHGG
jgi:hypothetical protein